jgi:UDP:flavonoid glycosyltransferase YjiC (YdhE family)
MSKPSKEYYQITWNGTIYAGVPVVSHAYLTEQKASELEEAGCTVRKVQDILRQRGWAR